MPVEIKQLIIKATVEEQPSDQNSVSLPGPADQATLVEACVRQVLRILKKTKER